MNDQINGYIVVRLPHLNNMIGPYSVNVPKLDDICYGGVERMPWFDIAEDFYSKKLPENIKHHWLSLRENNVDLPSISLVQDINIALELLAYSNRSEMRNELIAIRSKELIEYKGTIPTDLHSISWMGYDLVALPEWSLLHAGIFHSPRSFLPWKKQVNSEGLFNTLAFVDDYVKAYHQASLDNLVEEVWRLDEIAHIEVGRVYE